MTETMTVSKQWGLYAGLILAGIIGNYVKYPLFLSIDFLFGSIFAFLALQLFGLKRGLLASSIIASVTYLHWGHPYAILIFTSEILIVALLLRKIKINVILADAIYWFFIGLPMVYFFYHQMMGISLDTVYVVMAKQAVNGISNVLIFRVIYLIYVFLKHRNTAPFREVIYCSLIFCLAAPMLLFLSVESRTDLTKLEDEVQQALIDGRTNMEQLLSIWVSGRVASSSQLASLANSLPMEQLQSRFEQALGFDQNFAAFGFINKQGKSVYFAPKADEKGG